MVNLTMEVTGKHKVIFKFIENHPKILKYRSRSAILMIRENGKILFGTILFSGLQHFEDTFAVLPLAFSMLNSHVLPRYSRFVTIT